MAIFSLKSKPLLWMLLLAAVLFSVTLTSHNAFAGGSKPSPEDEATPTPSPTPSDPSSSINWQPPGKACLPVAGRMLPIMDWKTGTSISPAPPCHCPPVSYCPKNPTEWANEEKLPMAIQQVCCNRPDTMKCTIDVVMDSKTICPHDFQTGPEPANFCASYMAAHSNDPAVVEKRIGIAKTLNSCVSACKPHLDKAEAGIVQMESGNHADYKAFVDCEHQCRVSAASALSLPTPPISVNMTKGTYTFDFGDLGLGIVNHKEGYKTPTKRVHDFASAVLVQWKEPVPVRQKRVDEFLKNNPNPYAESGAGLRPDLLCEEELYTTICSHLMLNDESCASCLAPGTNVLLADGTSKAIELVTRGDVVKSDKGTSVVDKLVTREWPTLIFYSINGEALRLTADHPVQTTKGWRAIDYTSDLIASMDKYGLKDVQPLAVGDVLITDTGELPVTSIEPSETLINQTTYNLRLVDGDGFYANGVLVKDN